MPDSTFTPSKLAYLPIFFKLVDISLKNTTCCSGLSVASLNAIKHKAGKKYFWICSIGRVWISASSAIEGSNSFIFAIISAFLSEPIISSICSALFLTCFSFSLLIKSWLFKFSVVISDNFIEDLISSNFCFLSISFGSIESKADI